MDTKTDGRNSTSLLKVREAFAVQILQGLLAGPYGFRGGGDTRLDLAKENCRYAVTVADYLIEALNEKK